MSADIITLPPRPTEWDEAFSVSVARNGQIFVTAADGRRFPAPLMWALSDLCKRMMEFSNE
jgi:antitoxin (DNA-binding transcriptional repressor) of toxin-antitoxin stability system